MPDLTTPEPTWAGTRALGRTVVIVGTLALIGILLGRLDLLALVAPFAFATAWALRRRPSDGPTVTISMPHHLAVEGEDIAATVTVANPDPVDLDLVVVRVNHSRWLRLGHSHRPYVTYLASGRTSEVTLSGPALRWGLQQVGPAQVYGIACDGLLVSSPSVTAGARLKVHPQIPPFRASETMPRATMLVGTHRSRRPGEGGELAGVRRHAPGDRLRRIDWRVTLRTRELHVSQTLSDRDAEVVVLLDVLNEAGESGGVHGAASVLDTTVRAAAAIAEHYLHQGDRVAAVEYSGHPRHLRAASGRRQVHAVQEWLLLTRATEGSGDPPPFSIDPHVIPTAALVIVLTPLIATQSTDMIATLARAGRLVVAVDTLGAIAQHRFTGSEWTQLAGRLWRLERDNTIGSLREAGVPVTSWAGTGSLDEVLRDLTRMAAAPRIGRR